MRTFIGIDLGSTTTKAVVMDERRRVLGHGITNSRSNYDTAAAIAKQEALVAARFRLFREELAKSGVLNGDLQGFLAQLERDFRLEQYLEQLADQDTLAPVLNRRAFIRELGRMAAFQERYGAAGAVLYFDVNGLKAINDGLGHAAGDAVLKRVCEVLLRDTRASDVVGRLGGDEFGVILAQSGLEPAAAKAARLAQAIAAEEISWDGQPLKVTVAYGAHILASGQQADDALEAADRAMYANKRGGAGEG